MFFLFQQFEYQQAQLELEIENLSWKLERDELYFRGVSEKNKQTRKPTNQAKNKSHIASIIISLEGK